MDSYGVEWRTHGCADAGDVLEPEIWDQLINEAAGFVPNSDPYVVTNTAAHRDGSFASPCHFGGHAGGAMLLAVLRSAEMLDLARSLAGMPRLIPVRCHYNFYNRGDYIGVHRDSVKSTVTFTFALTDNVPPMGWAPKLRESNNHELAQFVDDNGHLPEPGAAAELPVKFRGMTAFDGYNVPHWRNTFDDDLGILGTLSFFEL
jgi:hypothetical protein